MKCRNCKNNTLLDGGVQFSWCEVRRDNIDIDEERYCGAFSSATNADRIRSMTDEELADFISNKARTFGEEYEGYMSALDWLREVAE